MVFNEYKKKFQARVRSALNTFRRSKSNIGMRTLLKAEMSGLRVYQPVPVPVLTLPSSISNRLGASTMFDGPMSHPDLDYQVVAKLDDSIPLRSEHRAESPSFPALDNNVLLEYQGLLGSPISLRHTSLISHSSEENLQPPAVSTPTTTHEMTVDPAKLGNARTSEPFTPDLFACNSGSPTSDFHSARTTKCECDFTQVISVSGKRSSSSTCSSQSSTSSSQETPRAKANAMFSTPDNPDSSMLELKVTPVRRCLRRKGPLPTLRPISSHLLQSLMLSPQPSPGLRSEFQHSPDMANDPHTIGQCFPEAFGSNPSVKEEDQVKMESSPIIRRGSSRLQTHSLDSNLNADMAQNLARASVCGLQDLCLVGLQDVSLAELGPEAGEGITSLTDRLKVPPSP